MFDAINQTNAQLSKLGAPVQKFNALLVSHLEKFAQFQLEAVRSYSDLSLEQLRAALDVNDPADFKSYVSQQNKVATVVGKKLSADTETLLSLSKDFTAEIQKFAQDNVVTLNGLVPAKAAAPKKAPARKSA